MKARMILLTVCSATIALGQDWRLPEGQPGSAMLKRYFEEQTSEIERNCLAEIQSKDDWTRHAPTYRRQLQEMLGLDPWPERTPLRPVITGVIDQGEFVVEKLHFQSLPGLYVTGNLYRPKDLTTKVPAILYVCGHSHVKEDGVSLGNKTGYQHHGAWFARHGYVCLVIDTIQLGEIEGIHHGTYRYGMWWWNSRGYTSAGVEAWNGLRAVDYLVSRPEVDSAKIGVTGRSGGGAYSWYVAALDERIAAAVPVAGITSLRNHILDGCVEGHCDCMYPQNLYRWDFGQLAALVAPRPLLISNTDKDTIFPLEGVIAVHEKARRVYRLLGAEKNLGLQITEGPHEDTQELHIHSFVWFDRFLKGISRPIEKSASKFFQPKELRVFHVLPKDERTSKIHESFVPKAPRLNLPGNTKEWEITAKALKGKLREKTFRGWPRGSEVVVEKRGEDRLGSLVREKYAYRGSDGWELPLYLVHSTGQGDWRNAPILLRVLDEASWKSMNEGKPEDLSALMPKDGLLVLLAPRGIGPSAWGGNEAKQIQIRRRFMLLGQTLASMRVYDVVNGLKALEALGRGPSALEASGEMALIALYAPLFHEGPNPSLIHLIDPPKSHDTGPDFLNVLRVLDVPEALALAARASRVQVTAKPEDEEMLSLARELAQGRASDWISFQAKP